MARAARLGVDHLALDVQGEGALAGAQMGPWRAEIAVARLPDGRWAFDGALTREGVFVLRRRRELPACPRSPQTAASCGVGVMRAEIAALAKVELLLRAQRRRLAAQRLGPATGRERAEEGAALGDDAAEVEGDAGLCAAA